jgi:hypothetical protein
VCEPTSIALVASAVIGLGTAYVSAENQKTAAEMAAAGEEQNAALARAQAADAMAAGDRETEASAWRNRAIQGQQRAAVAASGLDPVFGTPSELLGETAYFGSLEQQAIRDNAARSAWGFNAQATQFDNSAANTRWSGRAGARSTILGGVANAAGTLASGYASGYLGGANAATTIGPVTRQRIPIPQSAYRFG